MVYLKMKEIVKDEIPVPVQCLFINSEGSEGDFFGFKFFLAGVKQGI